MTDTTLPLATTSSLPEDMSGNIYTIVEYMNYRKELYVTVQGTSMDKATACAFAEKACRDNAAQYIDRMSTQIVKNIHNPDIKYDENAYVQIQERVGGKPIARYCCYTYGTPTPEFVKEYYKGFEEGKSVTLRDYVFRRLHRGKVKDYDAIAEKFDMTQVVGDHQTCSNLDLLIEVEHFMIHNNFGYARGDWDCCPASGVVFAVFEGKLLPTVLNSYVIAIH